MLTNMPRPEYRPTILSDSVGATPRGECSALAVDPLGSSGNTHDVAILTLASPVPMPWSPVDDLSERNFHRLLQGAGPLAGSDTLDLVGFGANSSSGTGGLGTRRYKAGVSFFRTSGQVNYPGPFSVLAGGDSGGPALWDDGVVSDYLEPVVAVNITSNGTTGIGTDLEKGGSNWDWVQSVIDADNNGRFDALCGELTDRGFDPLVTAATDADGDGYADSSDTCPGVFNPCQLGVDSDGDGDDDDCDPCPFIANEEPDDGDMDGVPDVCDLCPTIADQNNRDTDLDGRANVCDPCPGFPNHPSFLDSDGDGYFDDCDNCPFVANPTQEDLLDSPMPGGASIAPGDGVGDACDNCPTLLNPLQENCNIDAEEETGAPIRGDRCDPNPCGETRRSDEITFVSATTRRREMGHLNIDARGDDGMGGHRQRRDWVSLLRVWCCGCGYARGSCGLPDRGEPVFCSGR